MLSDMNLPTTLRRAWVTIGVPGTAHPESSTYVIYPSEGLPALPAALSQGDGLGWLRNLAAIDLGMAPNAWSYSSTPLSREGVEGLLHSAQTGVAFEQLPADLQAFASETTMVHRLFSATDAYVDAGERLEQVPGGHLLHLVSDSQWVGHWLAFIGDDGSTGVVYSPKPLGYLEEQDDDDEERDFRADEPVWVADSVAEFIWRWWADNHAFAVENPEISPSQVAPDWFDVAAYTAGYTMPATAPL